MEFKYQLRASEILYTVLFFIAHPANINAFRCRFTCSISFAFNKQVNELDNLSNFINFTKSIALHWPIAFPSSYFSFLFLFAVQNHGKLLRRRHFELIS